MHVYMNKCISLMDSEAINVEYLEGFSKTHKSVHVCLLRRLAAAAMAEAHRYLDGVSHLEHSMAHSK